MLAAHCPTHGKKVLLPESRIRALVNTERGIVVKLECYDGTEIVLRTGRSTAA